MTPRSLARMPCLQQQGATVLASSPTAKPLLISQKTVPTLLFVMVNQLLHRLSIESPRVVAPDPSATTIMSAYPVKAATFESAATEINSFTQ